MRSRWLTVAAWFAASRLVIFALGVTGVATFANVRTGLVTENRTAFDPTVVWHKWDSVWYEEIARFGYGHNLDTDHGRATGGYFPLYPMAVRGLMRLAPSLPFFPIAALLSNVLALAALFLLARELIPADDQVSRVMAIVATSAGSFYLSIPYAESLFLLLVVAVMAATRRRQYEIAGLLAGLSASARVHGLALVAVPAIACWLDRSLSGRSRWLRSAITIVLFAVPFVAYMAYLKQVQGSWFAFVGAQQLWDNPSPIPFQALTGFVHFPTRISNWLHGGFWLLYLGLLIRYWRRLPLGEALFCLGVFVITTQQEAFHGTYRYMVPLVPLTLALAADTAAMRHRMMAINIAFGVLMLLAFVTYNRLTV